MPQPVLDLNDRAPRSSNVRVNVAGLASKEGESAGHLSVVLEPHFTCKELAEKWHMSDTTVLKLFVD